MRSALRSAASLLAAVATVSAIPKVSRSGRYLYTEDGNRFYIKGIAYQEQGVVVTSPDNAFLEPSSFVDPLADGASCERDLPHLQELGVNAVRVYSVNSSLNHDTCMNALSGAGIYTIIDLALPLNGSIDRLAPSWSSNLLDQYTRTIDSFSKYDNVLAYNVGNEVVIDNGTAVSPYIKSAARDIKAYLKSKSSSALVGYAAINGRADWRDPFANYLSCDLSGQNSDATAIDLYGLNNYQWCGDSSFESSYAEVNADYAGYNVAAYFSEYGCLTTGARPFTEVAALFGPQMAPIWSGGVAFSYFPAESAAGQFGMITLSSDSKTVQTSTDFDNLKTQYGQVQFQNSPSRTDGATAYPSCPTQNSTFVASSTIPPTPNEAACSCLETNLSCRFTPNTNNYTAINGALIDTACQLLGQAGSNCNEIGGDGATGTYGRLSGCDPTVKLSYLMSKYYELNNRDQQACSFAGNGTVNSAAPASASAADSAASSCISNPSATFVPSGAPGSSGSGGSGGGSGGSGGSSGSGSPPNFQVITALASAGFIGLISAVWCLA